MRRVVLASCERPPVAPEDDPLLAAALRQAGCPVSIASWTQIDPSRLARGCTVLLRSTWDYHRHANRFLNWLAELEKARITVLNPPALVRLTMDKSWLVRERPFGCAVPRTILLPAKAGVISREVCARNWARYVLKPPVSASADGTFLLSKDDCAGLRAALQGQPAHVLVQEFLPEIREGEFSLVFFDGRFSHAVIKIPAHNDFRVQEEFGSRTQLTRPPAPALAASLGLLQNLPEMPCYARVDGIMRNDQFLLMEVELIEPDLFLRYHPGAASAFADVIVKRLGQA